MKPQTAKTPQSRRQSAGPPRPPSPEATSSEYWRIERVAHYLDVSAKRVYQLIQEKKLAAVRLSPRNTRVLRQSIGDYLAELAARDEALD